MTGRSNEKLGCCDESCRLLLALAAGPWRGSAIMICLRSAGVQCGVGTDCAVVLTAGIRHDAAPCLRCQSKVAANYALSDRLETTKKYVVAEHTRKLNWRVKRWETFALHD